MELVDMHLQGYCRFQCLLPKYRKLLRAPSPGTAGTGCIEWWIGRGGAGAATRDSAGCRGQQRGLAAGGGTGGSSYRSYRPWIEDHV